MQKGKAYSVFDTTARKTLFITGVIKFYKRLIRLLKHARPSLLRLILIYSIITTVLLGLLLFYIWDAYEQSYQQKIVLESRLLYWENVVEAHQNFPDAYFNAALYAFRLRNKEKAYKYIEKALVIDPTFADAKKLRADILKD